MKSSIKSLKTLFILFSAWFFSASLSAFGSPLDYDFTGTVKLSNCSGSLVRFLNSKETDKALVLTNGHCTTRDGGYLAPGEFKNRISSTRKFEVLSRVGRPIGQVTATELTYATTTGTDIALYKLKESYLDIENKFDVPALVLSDRPATVATEFDILSGYWQEGYSCSVREIVYRLLEDPAEFTNSIKSSTGCRMKGGSSGSPIIDKRTQLLIGVHNTSNDSGESCTFNNPCEVDRSGRVTVELNAAYGQQVYMIYSCLNEDNEFDLSQQGCLLTNSLSM